MLTLSTFLEAVNAHKGYEAKRDAGFRFIVSNAVSVEASEDLRVLIRAALDKEANSRAYSMCSYPSEHWDLIRDFDYFAAVYHGDVRVAHGLTRHRYNCGGDCCSDHTSPVGSWT